MALYPIIMAGGSFNPFARFYQAILQKTRQDPSLTPSDNFHFVLLTPSLTYDSPWVQAQVSAQVFWIETDTTSDQAEPIRGMNLRAGVRGRIWRDRITPFFNFSRVTNTVVDPRDPSGITKTMEGQDWRGMTLSAGVDVNLRGRSGLGVEYARVMGRQGDSGIDYTDQYINMGGTLWFNQHLALAARVGMRLSRDSSTTADAQGNQVAWSKTARQVGTFLSVRAQF